MSFNVIVQRVVKCATLVLFIFCVIVGSPAHASEAKSSEVANSPKEVALLLESARSVIIADQLTMAQGTNDALLYIDRVLEVDPGNPQAILLLHTIISQYSKLMELVLSLADSSSQSFALSEAGKLRDQAAQIIAKYQLDKKLSGHMDRMIVQAGSRFNKTESALAGLSKRATKIEKNEYRQEGGYTPSAPVPVPKQSINQVPTYNHFNKWRVIGNF